MLEQNREMTTRLAHSLNLFLAVGFVLAMVCNGILGVGLYFLSQSQSRTVVPPVISSAFTVSNHQIDTPYLTMMAEWIVSQRFNVTPANVERRFGVFLEYVDEAAWSQIQPALVSESAFIRKNNVSSHLDIDSIEVDAAQLITRVKGTLHKSIARRALDPEPVSYLLQLHYDAELSLLAIKQEIDHE